MTTLADFYEMSEYKGKLSKKKYRAVLEKYFREVNKQVIREGRIFKIPCNLGELRIQKKKRHINSTPSRIDWVETKKLGKWVVHKNWHTDGFYFKHKWEKPRLAFKNLRYYRFQPLRDEIKKEVGKRGLSSWINHCNDPNTPNKTYDSLS